MAFDSYSFLLFFAPAAIGVFWALRPGTARLVWLTLAGYAFYATFDWRFLPLLGFVTLATYGVGTALARGGPRRLLLSLGVTAALLPLLVFKCWPLARSVTAARGVHPEWLRVAKVVFPVGLSFYTFQSLTYCLDIFHGRARPARNLLQHASFVSFFPTLLAGPITRWSQMGPALEAMPPALGGDDAVHGIVFVVIGLAEKTLVADSLERYVVTPLFAGAATHGFFLAWVAALAYGSRLYFDFAGYSDMAVGLGRLLGISLPRNFALPYQAHDIGDFWERWHISLSNWFRDYLFFPLSRALLRRTDRRHPELIRAMSYVVTMGLIGLWHGATAALVLWGLYHAALLIIFHAARPRRGSTWDRMQRPLTFMAVTIGWVLFRSADLAGAVQVWSAMAGLRGFEHWAEVSAAVGWPALAFVVAVVFWLQAGPDAWSAELPRTRLAAVSLGVVAAVALGMLAAPEPFVYFKF